MTTPSAPAGGREPILNGPPPWGVGAFGLVIVLVYLLFPAGVPGRSASLAFDYGFVPARVGGTDGVAPYGSPLEILRALITYQFLHAGWVHLAMNTMLLVAVGPVAERGLGTGRTGAGRFVVFTLLCGIGGALGFWLLNQHMVTYLIGASGAFSGVFAGFIWTALARAFERPELRQEALSSGLVFLGLNVGLAALARVSGTIPIAWESHLFGFLTGLVIYPFVAGAGWQQALALLRGRRIPPG